LSFDINSPPLLPAAGAVSLFAFQLAFEIFGALDGQAGFALPDSLLLSIAN
jgi:hypothetical protein